MNKITQKTIVVTGGSSGIGRAIAGGLHDHGYRVVILSRRTPTTWETPMPSSWDANKNWIKIDFQDKHLSGKQLAKWLQKEEKIDGLIHCAVTYGSTGRHTFETTLLSEWDELFTVNTRAAFIITQAFLPYLEKAEASLVVGFASSVTYSAGPGRIGYAASKHALHGMLVGLAEEKNDTTLNVAEILPFDIVRTPGIEKRRKKGFDYIGYASPAIFVAPVMKLLKTMGKSYHGKCIIVTRDGKMKTIVMQKPLQ